MADINVISSIKVNNAAPADAKYLVANAAALETLLASGNAYVGMQCYNQDDNKLYIVYSEEVEGVATLKAKELLGSTASDITAIEGRLDVIEGEAEGSIKKAVNDLKESLDAEVTSTDGARVTVKVTEVDGKVTAVNVTEDDIAQKSLLDAEVERVGAIPESATATTVIGYVDEVVAAEASARTTAIENLDATVRGNMDESDAVTAANKVGVKVVEADGKITEVKVVTNDIASASDLSTLTGRVDTLQGEDTTKSVRTIAAEEAAKIVADAPEAYDTLKEIAEFIAKDGENGFDAAVRIQNLEAAVGDTTSGAVKDIDDLQAAVGTNDSKGDLFTRVAAVEGLMGEDSVEDQIADAIDALEADFTGNNAVTATNGHVTVSLKEEDGVITSFGVATSDIASAALLGAATDAATADTAFGKIAKAQAAADAAKVNEVEFVAGDALAGSFASNKLTLTNVASAKALSTEAGKVAKLQALAGLDELAAEGQNAKTFVSRIKANEDAIAKINGSEEGSIAKAVADEKDRIDGVIGTLTKSTVVAEIADAKQAGTDAKINTVAFNSGTALAGAFANNTLTLTDVAQASVLASEAGEIDKLQALIGESEISTGESTIVARLGVIEGEESVDGSIKKALKDAKDYADGKTATEAARITKLEATHAKVGGEGADKDNFKTVAQEVAAVTGTPDAGTTLQAEIDAVEGRLDTIEGEAAGSIKKAVKDAVEALDAEITSNDGARVQVKVTEVDGKITAVNVTENDIAQASYVGTIPSSGTGSAATNIVDYAKALMAQEAANRGTAIGQLGADFTGAKAVASTDGHVTVGLKEEAGVVTALTVATSDIASAALLGAVDDDKSKATAFGKIAAEADARATAITGVETKIGTVPAKVGETDTATVVAYVDAKVAAANTSADDAIKALDADVTSDDETLVTVEVKEVDGKITDVVVADTEKATALRTDITNLQALHAAGTHNGKSTVAEEVAAGIAALRDGADEAFDTLKEIANWINDSDVNAEGFNAASRITNLQTAVGTEAVPNTAPEGEASNAKEATGLVKDVRALQAAVGAGGSVDAQIDAKINALDATVADKLNATKDALAEGEKVGIKVVEEDGKLTSVAVFTNDIASAALVGAKTDAKTADTVFGAIAKVADDLATEVSNREAYNAPGAKKLVNADASDVAVGDVNTPVYFVNGLPVASTFTVKTSVPEGAVFTDTTYTAVAATEGADAGLMTSADKIKLDTIVNGATKVEASDTNGNIKINGTETNVYTHPATSGNKHIPTGGAAGQYLKYSADGTATWAEMIRTGSEVPEDLAAGELFIQLV